MAEAPTDVSSSAPLYPNVLVPVEETISPIEDLKPVVPECEVLSPDAELGKMPWPPVETPIPPPRIGTGVSPVDEGKEEETIHEEEAPKEEENDDEKCCCEEETVLTEASKEKEEVEEKCCCEGESELTEEILKPEEELEEVVEEKDFWEFLKIPEVAAMVTLAESAFSAVCRQLEPVTAKMYDKKTAPVVDQLFGKLEQLTGSKRENLTYGTVLFLIIYFLVGNLVQITCNLVGFLYPAWRSIKAVRSASKDDDTQWLIYWVCFAFFSVLDLSMFSSIPFYWMGKVVFLLYLYLPHFKGANHIYNNYVDPGCSLIESYFTPREEKKEQ